MQHRRSLSLLGILSLASVLALTGCSNSDGGDPPEETSPLMEYIGAVYGGDLTPEQQQERIAEQERELEDLVAACMQEEGFDYTPNPQSGAFVSADGIRFEPEDREWVAQYGYGVVDYPGRDEPVDPDQEYVDANADYVAGLPEAEQAAYSEALNGPDAAEETSDDATTYEYDWSTAGCYGSAQHERDADDPVQSDEHKPLVEALTAFYTDLSAAPELAGLDAEWATCMTDAGEPGFTMQSDAQASVQDDLTVLQEAAGESALEPSDPKLEELGKQEIALALVDLECREKIDYRAEQKTIQDEKEQQFVDDHRAELDALKSDAEQGR